MTAIEVTAPYAAPFHRYGRPRIRAPPAASQIALVGVLVRLFTRCQICEPGSAPARENAEIIRELAGVEDMPQNNWAPITTSSSNSAPVRPIESIQIWAG